MVADDRGAPLRGPRNEFITKRVPSAKADSILPTLLSRHLRVCVRSCAVPPGLGLIFQLTQLFRGYLDVALLGCRIVFPTNHCITEFRTDSDHPTLAFWGGASPTFGRSGE